MKRWQLSFLAAAVAGCGLINSHTLSADYAFDAQHYGADLGADTGNKMPIVVCDPAAKPDPCAQLQFPDKLYGQCQSDTRQCAAVADVSLAYTVDYRTAQTQLPTPVVQYSIDHVS